MAQVADLRSGDSGIQLLSFDAFVEEKGRFDTSLTCSLSLYGGGSHYFEYADIWEDSYQGQPVGESRVLHGEWKLDGDTITLTGELYAKSHHMSGPDEERTDEHKSLVFAVLPDGNLKFQASQSNFAPFGDGVIFRRGEVLNASSPIDADEAAKQRRKEIAALASPEGKRLAQEKKHVVRSMSLEKVRRQRQNFTSDKSSTSN